MTVSGPPRVLGRYALYDAIASGGMAAVHLGRLVGPAGFSRTVAIKRLHSQYASDREFVAMFLDEARLVARIRHPNVVPTIDIVTTDGELFLVMEYVQGESLASLIRGANARSRRVPPGVAATVMAGVLHGLHAAHEATSEQGEPLGIVHRDVSPQNVLVGVDGVARVLDFGVAKAAGRLQSTSDGQLKGKTAYMSPEQICSAEVTRTTDVYAAAVVLWETLTGRRLFSGDNQAAVMKRVLDGNIVPPSTYASVSPALDAVTLRGLRKDPSERFPTARDMARALEAAVPPVPCSNIGEWVESIAGETVAERSERVAAIESDSALASTSAVSSVLAEGSAPRTAARVPLPPPSTVATRVETAVVTDDMFIVTQFSSADGSIAEIAASAVAPPNGSRLRRRRLVTGGAVAALGAAILGIVLVGTHEGPAAHTPVAAASPVPPPPASHQLPPAADTPSTPWTLAVDPRSTEPVAVPASALPRANTGPPRPAVTPAKPGKGASCDPLYYFDAQGNQVFKKECL